MTGKLVRISDKAHLILKHHSHKLTTPLEFVSMGTIIDRYVKGLNKEHNYVPGESSSLSS